MKLERINRIYITEHDKKLLNYWRIACNENEVIAVPKISPVRKAITFLEKKRSFVMLTAFTIGALPFLKFRAAMPVAFLATSVATGILNSSRFSRKLPKWNWGIDDMGDRYRKNPYSDSLMRGRKLGYLAASVMAFGFFYSNHSSPRADVREIIRNEIDARVHDGSYDPGVPIIGVIGSHFFTVSTNHIVRRDYDPKSVTIDATAYYSRTGFWSEKTIVKDSISVSAEVPRVPEEMMKKMQQSRVMNLGY